MTLLFVAVMGLAAVGLMIWLVVVEDRNLTRAAQRYRELEDEGIESLRPDDLVMPEFAWRSATMRLPDGREVDAADVLREELGRLRRYQEEQERPTGGDPD